MEGDLAEGGELFLVADRIVHERDAERTRVRVIDRRLRMRRVRREVADRARDIEVGVDLGLDVVEEDTGHEVDLLAFRVGDAELVRRALVLDGRDHALRRVAAQRVVRLADVVVAVGANLGVAAVVEAVVDLAIEERAGVDDIERAEAAVDGQRELVELVVEPVREEALHLEVADDATARGIRIKVRDFRG